MCNLGEGIAEQARAETRLEEHKKSAKMIFEKLHAPVETVAEMYPDLSYDTIKMLKAECDNAKKIRKATAFRRFSFFLFFFRLGTQFPFFLLFSSFLYAEKRKSKRLYFFF